MAMTRSPGQDADLREAIAAERRDMADVLSDLPSRSWDAQTLCAGWRVREVVAHMTMPFRYSTARFVTEIIRSRGDFNRMADRCARRDAAMPTGELLAALRDNSGNPWKPPGGGFRGALVHDVIHGLDITVPLGIGRRIPEEHMRTVLEVIAGPKTLKYFGAGLNGIELRADDIDWSFGSGTPVSGPAQDLALVLCGRKLPAGRLRGTPSVQFTDA
jgi:uncharacterized protein (TIGR03083 family)